MQKFSSDSSILNYVRSLPMIASENEEEFDFSNDVAGVKKSNTLDILEIISDFRSDPFTLIDLDLLANSYMISCTNTQSFVEEGENGASTISLEQMETLFHTLGVDMTLYGSNFKF